MRILIGGCQQEISTFNPVPCDYEFFDYLRGDEIRATHDGNDSQIGGALAELKSAFGDDLEVVYTYDAEGTAAGPLRHSAFMRIAEEFLEPLKEHAGKIDGVYFSMHGAMGTTELLDPEGYLRIKRIHTLDDVSKRILRRLYLYRNGDSPYGL